MREKLIELGIDLKNIKTSGKTICPKCSANRKNKSDLCLSVDLTKGAFNCHNCSWSGYVEEAKQEDKQYSKPIFNNRTELSEPLVNWFFKRGISQQTLIDFKITESTEWMPQTGKNENCINFNYFRSDELVNIKYRDGAKRFKLFKDAELIMYNVDAIFSTDSCIICEGEIDAMSWHEAGFKNVVSVPNGASKNQKMLYLDNCWKYFEDKTKFYLSTDNDEAGIRLKDELIRRFGAEKCYRIDLGTYKDANEALKEESKSFLIECFDKAKEIPIDGIFSIRDVEADLDNVFLNGLPTGDSTGDNQLDHHIGFMPGELTVITGIPGHGKSIYLDQISIGLAKNADWRFAICSPESYPLSFYYSRLIKRIVGKKFSHKNISQADYIEVKNWITDRYDIILPDEGFSLDIILDKARSLVLRKGIKGLIIDPWNRIEANLPANYNEGKFVNEQLTKLIKFAQKTGVHVFLVAHPTKMQKEKDGFNYVVPNLYNISGSANFFNMTQNGMTVYRNYVEGTTEVHIQKVKWEHLGKIGMCRYVYQLDNARFVQEGTEDNSNWIKGSSSAMTPNYEFDYPSSYSTEQTEEEAPF